MTYSNSPPVSFYKPVDRNFGGGGDGEGGEGGEGGGITNQYQSRPRAKRVRLV